LAYDSYYKDKDNDIAKPLYELVTKIYPESKEAVYSKTQLKEFAA